MPTAWGVGLLIAAIGIALVFWLLWWPSLRARHILRHPFPSHWRRILQQRVAFYRRLPTPLKKRLEHLVQLFLHDKTFYGAGGLTITDTIRVTIAAEACLLILGRTMDDYARLKSIIVYPSRFLVDGEHQSIRLGESWHNGRVILAWDEVASNSMYLPPGHNVSVHEFAHQLDQEDGYADGLPNIPASAVRVWSEAFSEALVGLREQLASEQPSYLNPYGSTNAAEFFAVCSEAYFTDPQRFSEIYPKLFDLLKAFYRIDPRTWLDSEKQAVNKSL